MDDHKIQQLLRECLDALKMLGADKRPQYDDANLVYRKIKSQLDYVCSGCGRLMDWDNCCVADARTLKMYHPGCQPKPPKKPKPTLKDIKALDDKAKMDFILESVWKLMDRK